MRPYRHLGGNAPPGYGRAFGDTWLPSEVDVGRSISDFDRDPLILELGWCRGAWASSRKK